MAKNKAVEWLTEEKLIVLRGWARNGLTDEQIAHNMGINRTTLYDYKNNYTDIADALKKGKEVIDLEVENALLKRAMGYEYEETTREGRGDGMVITKTVTKQVVPDTTAQIFWLKNRKPSDWRDKQEVENNNSLQIVFKDDYGNN